MARATRKPRAWIQGTAIGTLVCFVYTNVVYGALAPAKSLWQERRAAVSKAQPLLLARLPSLGPDLLSNSLPSRLDVQSQALNQQYAGLSAQVPAVLKSLPLSYVSLKELYLPKNYKPGDLLVLHIQDAHGNLEAQKNIAKVIEALVSGSDPAQSPRVLVGLEGARGAFNFTPYRTFPDKGITQKVAGYLLQQSLITGPEYAGMLVERLPTYWGLEEEKPYLDHVQAYLDSSRHEKEAQEVEKRLEQALSQMKKASLGPKLAELDAKMTAYHQGKIGLGDYLSHLGAGSGKNTRMFLEALKLEKSLNYNAVEEQKKSLTQALAAKLPKPDLDKLLQASLSYRAGDLTHGTFYRYLTDVCRSHGIALSHYPEMEKYVRYVLASESIHSEGLFRELQNLEQTRVRELAKTEAEKEAIALSQDLLLAEKVMSYGVSSVEWEAYQVRKEEIQALPKRLGRNAPLQALLDSYGRFSQCAVARNGILIQNLLTKAQAEKDRLAILVTGGFHTPGMMAELKAKHIAYAVVTPRLGEVEGTGTEYLQVFRRDKTPLEKMFSGDKITLAPALRTAYKAMMGFKGIPEDELTSEQRLVQELFVAMLPALLSEEQKQQILESESGLRMLRALFAQVHLTGMTKIDSSAPEYRVTFASAGGKVEVRGTIRMDGTFQLHQGEYEISLGHGRELVLAPVAPDLLDSELRRLRSVLTVLQGLQRPWREKCTQYAGEFWDMTGFDWKAWADSHTQYPGVDNRQEAARRRGAKAIRWVVLLTALPLTPIGAFIAYLWMHDRHNVRFPWAALDLGTSQGGSLRYSIDQGNFNQDLWEAISPSDRALMERFMSSTRTEQQALLAAHSDKVFVTKDALQAGGTGRSLYVRLEEDSEIYRRGIRVLQIKGARTEIVPVDGEDRAQERRNSEFVRSVTAEGDVVTAFGREINAQGGLDLNSARQEYRLYGRLAALPSAAAVPIGVLRYEHRVKWTKEELGILILGLREDDRRLRVVEGNFFSFNKLTGARENLNASRLQIAEKLGAALRLEHDAGFYHGVIHQDNVRIVASPDGPQPLLVDRESSLDFNGLPLLQRVGLRLADLADAIILLSSLESVHGASADRLRMARAFLGGYLQADDPAAVDAVLGADRDFFEEFLNKHRAQLILNLAETGQPQRYRTRLSEQQGKPWYRLVQALINNESRRSGAGGLVSQSSVEKLYRMAAPAGESPEFDRWPLLVQFFGGWYAAAWETRKISSLFAEFWRSGDWRSAWNFILNEHSDRSFVAVASRAFGLLFIFVAVSLFYPLLLMTVWFKTGHAVAVILTAVIAWISYGLFSNRRGTYVPNFLAHLLFNSVAIPLRWGIGRLVGILPLRRSWKAWLSGNLRPGPLATGTIQEVVEEPASDGSFRYVITRDPANSAIAIVRLPAGGEIRTRLGNEDIQRLIRSLLAEPDRKQLYVVEQHVGALQVRTQQNARSDAAAAYRKPYGDFETPFERTDKFLQLTQGLQELRARRGAGAPLPILEWGVGDGTTLLALHQSAEDPRARFYGFGDIPDSHWLQAPAGVTFVLDVAEHLEEYFSQGELHLIYSWLGLGHLESDQAGAHIEMLFGLLAPQGQLRAQGLPAIVPEKVRRAFRSVPVPQTKGSYYLYEKQAGPSALGKIMSLSPLFLAVPLALTGAPGLALTGWMQALALPPLAMALVQAWPLVLSILVLTGLVGWLFKESFFVRTLLYGSAVVGASWFGLPWIQSAVSSLGAVIPAFAVLSQHYAMWEPLAFFGLINLFGLLFPQLMLWSAQALLGRRNPAALQDIHDQIRALQLNNVSTLIVSVTPLLIRLTATFLGINLLIIPADWAMALGAVSFIAIHLHLGYSKPGQAAKRWRGRQVLLWSLKFLALAVAAPVFGAIWQVGIIRMGPIPAFAVFFHAGPQLALAFKLVLLAAFPILAVWFSVISWKARKDRVPESAPRRLGAIAWRLPVYFSAAFILVLPYLYFNLKPTVVLAAVGLNVIDAYLEIVAQMSLHGPSRKLARTIPAHFLKRFATIGLFTLPYLLLQNNAGVDLFMILAAIASGGIHAVFNAVKLFGEWDHSPLRLPAWLAWMPYGGPWGDDQPIDRKEKLGRILSGLIRQTNPYSGHVYRDFLSQLEDFVRDALNISAVTVYFHLEDGRFHLEMSNGGKVSAAVAPEGLTLRLVTGGMESRLRQIELTREQLEHYPVLRRLWKELLRRLSDPLQHALDQAGVGVGAGQIAAYWEALGKNARKPASTARDADKKTALAQLHAALRGAGLRDDAAYRAQVAGLLEFRIEALVMDALRALQGRELGEDARKQAFLELIRQRDPQLLRHDRAKELLEEYYREYADLAESDETLLAVAEGVALQERLVAELGRKLDRRAAVRCVDAARQVVMRMDVAGVEELKTALGKQDQDPIGLAETLANVPSQGLAHELLELLVGIGGGEQENRLEVFLGAVEKFREIRNSSSLKPVEFLLRRLGLENPNAIPGFEAVESAAQPPLPHGGWTRRFRDAGDGRGQSLKDLLRREFGRDAREFNLVFDKNGHLIGIFPAEGNPNRFYFNFSYYYYRLPDLSRPADAEQEWRQIALGIRQSREILDGYLAFLGDTLGSFVEIGRERSPYVLVTLDRGTGEYKAENFYPERLGEGGDFPRIEPGKANLILPLFPTVYTPGSEDRPDLAVHSQEDRHYHEALYRDARTVARATSSVLVLGPGSGVDAWVLSLAGIRKVHAVGLNPLEIANLEATAALAGLEAIARVGDNIVDRKGRPRFPQAQFGRIYWNMPALSFAFHGDAQDERYSWDGDVSGESLKVFVQGLRKVLAPRGKAILWNVEGPGEEVTTEGGRTIWIPTSLEADQVFAILGRLEKEFRVTYPTHDQPNVYVIEGWPAGAAGTLIAGGTLEAYRAQAAAEGIALPASFDAWSFGHKLRAGWFAAAREFEDIVRPSRVQAFLADHRGNGFAERWSRRIGIAWIYLVMAPFALLVPLYRLYWLGNPQGKEWRRVFYWPNFLAHGFYNMVAVLLRAGPLLSSGAAQRRTTLTWTEFNWMSYWLTRAPSSLNDRRHLLESTEMLQQILESLVGEWFEPASTVIPKKGKHRVWGDLIARKSRSSQWGNLVVKLCNDDESPDRELVRIALGGLILAAGGAPAEEIMVPVRVSEDLDRFAYRTRDPDASIRLTASGQPGGRNVYAALKKATAYAGILFRMGVGRMSFVPVSHRARLAVGQTDYVLWSNAVLTDDPEIFADDYKVLDQEYFGDSRNWSDSSNIGKIWHPGRWVGKGQDNFSADGVLLDIGDTRVGRGPWIPTSVARRAGAWAFDLIGVALRAIPQNDPAVMAALQAGNPEPLADGVARMLGDLWREFLGTGTPMPKDMTEFIQAQLAGPEEGYLRSESNRWVWDNRASSPEEINLRDYYQIINIVRRFAKAVYDRGEEDQQRDMTRRLLRLATVLQDIYEDHNAGRAPKDWRRVPLDEALYRDVRRRFDAQGELDQSEGGYEVSTSFVRELRAGMSAGAAVLPDFGLVILSNTLTRQDLEGFVDTWIVPLSQQPDAKDLLKAILKVAFQIVPNGHLPGDRSFAGHFHLQRQEWLLSICVQRLGADAMLGLLSGDADLAKSVSILTSVAARPRSAEYEDFLSRWGLSGPGGTLIRNDTLLAFRESLESERIPLDDDFDAWRFRHKLRAGWFAARHEFADTVRPSRIRAFLAGHSGNGVVERSSRWIGIAWIYLAMAPFAPLALLYRLYWLGSPEGKEWRRVLYWPNYLAHGIYNTVAVSLRAIDISFGPLIARQRTVPLSQWVSAGKEWSLFSRLQALWNQAFMNQRGSVTVKSEVEDNSYLQTALESLFDQWLWFDKVDVPPTLTSQRNWGRSWFWLRNGLLGNLVVKTRNPGEVQRLQAVRMAMGNIALAAGGAPIRDLQVPVLGGDRDASYGYWTHYARPNMRITDRIGQGDIRAAWAKAVRQLGFLYWLGVRKFSIIPLSHRSDYDHFLAENVMSPSANVETEYFATSGSNGRGRIVNPRDARQFANILWDGALCDGEEVKWGKGPWHPTSVARGAGEYAFEVLFAAIGSVARNDPEVYAALQRGNAKRLLDAVIGKADPNGVMADRDAGALGHLWKELLESPMPGETAARMRNWLEHYLSIPDNRWLWDDQAPFVPSELNSTHYWELYNIALVFMKAVIAQGEEKVQGRMMRNLALLLSVMQELYDENAGSGGEPRSLRVNEDLYRKIQERYRTKLEQQDPSAPILLPPTLANGVRLKLRRAAALWEVFRFYARMPHNKGQDDPLLLFVREWVKPRAEESEAALGLVHDFLQSISGLSVRYNPNDFLYLFQAMRSEMGAAQAFDLISAHADLWSRYRSAMYEVFKDMPEAIAEYENRREHKHNGVALILFAPVFGWVGLGIGAALAVAWIAHSLWRRMERRRWIGEYWEDRGRSYGSTWVDQELPLPALRARMAEVSALWPEVEPLEKQFRFLRGVADARAAQRIELPEAIAIRDPQSRQVAKLADLLVARMEAQAEGSRPIALLFANGQVLEAMQAAYPQLLAWEGRGLTMRADPGGGRFVHASFILRETNAGGAILTDAADGFIEQDIPGRRIEVELLDALLEKVRHVSDEIFEDLKAKLALATSA